jgi:predicted membrane protein
MYGCCVARGDLQVTCDATKILLFAIAFCLLTFLFFWMFFRVLLLMMGPQVLQQQVVQPQVAQ